MTTQSSDQSRPFLIGVNYWPRRKAMYWWEDFDAGEVREEFAIIADLGITHVRIFLLWESFQPSRGTVNTRCLEHLRDVCDIAGENHLYLQVVFFTGHMSGPGWAPKWLIDDSRLRQSVDRQLVGVARPAGDEHAIHSPYDVSFVIEAEDYLLRSVCSAVGNHPAVWSWSLGNEPDLFHRPASAAAGRRWVRARVATIREVDPDRPVLIGLHYANLEADVGFRIRRHRD